MDPGEGRGSRRKPQGRTPRFLIRVTGWMATGCPTGWKHLMRTEVSGPLAVWSRSSDCATRGGLSAVAVRHARPEPTLKAGAEVQPGVRT